MEDRWRHDMYKEEEQAPKMAADLRLPQNQNLRGQNAGVRAQDVKAVGNRGFMSTEHDFRYVI